MKIPELNVIERGNMASATAEEPTVTDPDKAAETAMNGKKKVILPENEYKVFQEIIKHPVTGELKEQWGENAYMIPQATNDTVFPDNPRSSKSMVQAAKEQLEKREVIRIVRPGTRTEEVIFELLNGNVELRQGGQGRKAGVKTTKVRKPRTTTATAKATSDTTTVAKKRGRPRKDPAIATPAVATKRERVTKSGSITIEGLRAKLMQPKRTEAYLNLMQKVLENYSDLFEQQFSAK
jgi:hypothetical protein